MSTPSAASTTTLGPPPSSATTARGFSGYDLAILAVVVIWGTNYTPVKEALGAFPPLAMGALLLWFEGWKPLPRATL